MRAIILIMMLALLKVAMAVPSPYMEDLEIKIMEERIKLLKEKLEILEKKKKESSEIEIEQGKLEEVIKMEGEK